LEERGALIKDEADEIEEEREDLDEFELSETIDSGEDIDETELAKEDRRGKVNPCGDIVD
jgi:hypothetical protein